ncbi:MAG TPA: glycosyltransferase family 4 protein [Solirubrobacteraceae bacterium]|jgi:glycosyltransferase involved in cell wall biosynthesis|nr:glycosyltransferase family 4 protein [Solirubrobacteraceae bacterium]
MSPIDRRVVVVSAVLPHPPISGAHKRTLRLIEAIARAGGVPHLLTADRGEPGAAQELRAREWVVELLAQAPRSPTARLRQHLARLPSPYLSAVAARLRELAPRSVFVQFEHAQSAYYWGTIGGARSVLSLHNVDSQMLATVARESHGLAKLRALNRALAMRSVERRAVPRADVVLAVSERDCRHFARNARQVVHVPNGIDDAFFAIPASLPDTEDVLFFGHFGYRPNELGVMRLLHEGWPRLAALRPRARLLLAGSSMPQRLAQAAASAERVVALGFVSDLPSLLMRSRVVLIPIWQGGGTRLKALESLAAGRPLVGTSLGVEEIGFVHARHGLVANDAAGLAEHAAALLADRTRSEGLARAGRELAERYRWRRALEPAEQLYRGWLGVTAQS